MAEPAAAAVVGGLLRQLLSVSPEAAPSLLRRLEEAVHTYEVEFRAFLNRQGGRPPLVLGDVLVVAFAELEAAPGIDHLLSFQLEGLEARFRSAQRLYTQRLERRRPH